MDKLHEVDFILAQLEDTAHGEESKKVGMARKLISELIASNGAKPLVASSTDFEKLKAAIVVSNRGVIDNNRCDCIEPLLLNPPYGFCYRCEKLKVPKRKIIVVVDNYSVHEVEEQIIRLQIQAYPDMPREKAAEMLGLNIRTYLRRLEKYGIGNCRKSGKKPYKI